MTRVEVNQDGFVIDATLLAEAFNLNPEDIQPLLRTEQITSICEAGVDDDAGRSRLTFHYRDQTVRFVVDQAGHVLNRTRFPARARPTTTPQTR
ncbi:DUF6522 family protein [Pararhodobacter sp.]|uniref:DUF6522 family protein n=1 Tax=Pararhodobacter sp. TaxID=2127056 RepID=UPI002AFF2451|nr:DUF6522 family protein [Pararhodobacter sp.]